MAKGKSGASTKRVGRKKGGRKNKRTFKTFISRVNKASGRKLTISSKAVSILNSMCMDFFDKIATQAAAVARGAKKTTMRAAEVQTATRLVLPADLAKHSISEASKAVTAVSK